MMDYMRQTEVRAAIWKEISNRQDADMKISKKGWTVKIERERYAAVLLSSAVWFIPLRTLLIKVGNMYHDGAGGYGQRYPSHYSLPSLWRLYFPG